MRIVRKAYAKINWTLAVTGKREDGYHTLDMLMQSINLADILSFEASDVLRLETENGFHRAGANADSESVPIEKNLVYRAAKALNAFLGTEHGAYIHLTKRIPGGAGLGGGSADCAAALLGLNELWNAHVPMKELLRIGLRLGADVPFCLTGGLCRVRGIGEIIEPIPVKHSGIHLALLLPKAPLSTADVFRKFDEIGSDTSVNTEGAIKALYEGDEAAFLRNTGNDLEKAAGLLCPEVGQYLCSLRGGVTGFGRMTGSGSTVFTVYPDAEEAVIANSFFPVQTILAQTI